MTAIFLSYRREDSAGWVGRLGEALREALGHGSVFMDVDSIVAGADFAEAITRTVASCDVLLAVIGPRWLNATRTDGVRRLDEQDDYVRLEVASALERQIRVIPVLVGNARMPSAEQLPDQIKALARRQAHELSDSRWDYDVRALLNTLHDRSRAWRRKTLVGTAAAVAVAASLGLVAVTSGYPFGKAWPSRIQELPPTASSNQANDLGQAANTANEQLLAAIRQIGVGQPAAALSSVRQAESSLNALGSKGGDENVRLLRGYIYKVGAQAAHGLHDDGAARTYADLAENVFRSIEADAAAGRISPKVLAGALNGLGNILCHERGDCAAAVASYRRATDLEPAYAYAWHDMLLAELTLARAGQVDIAGMRHALDRLRDTAPGVPGITPERIASMAQEVDTFAGQAITPKASSEGTTP